MKKTAVARKSGSRSAARRKAGAGPKKSAPSTNGAPAVRLARIPKGRKPQYFSDPAIDKLLSMTMTLAAELSVARDRIDTLERLIERSGLFSARDVDDYLPTADVEAAREARRAAYIARVLRAVHADLEETTNSAMPKSQEEVIAAVSA